MQEGGMAQRPAVRQRRRPLGRIENQLNTAVFDGIHDMGPPFQHLVDLGRRHPLFREVTLGSRRWDGLEEKGCEELYCWQNTGPVDLLPIQTETSDSRRRGSAAA